jgi:uncharacterized protein DUF4349
MKSAKVILFALVMLALAGCKAYNRESAGAPADSQRPEAQSSPAASAPERGALRTRSSIEPSSSQSGDVGAKQQNVSLLPASPAEAQPETIDRKIIRNANLIIELDAPADGQRRLTAIAESHGGFVVTSEFKQNDGRAPGKPSQVVNVIMRVPSSQFLSALDMVRTVGVRTTQETVAGQDVTQEYIDLEARIRTKKALEAQFLEIMKQARKVSEALEVQSEIADVRTEIEQLEGRRRFLENQSALSTINVTLQTPVPIVTATTSSFGDSIKNALGDGVDVAASIVLGLVRLIIVMVPIFVLIVLPVALVSRMAWRRYRPFKKPEPVEVSGQ